MNIDLYSVMNNEIDLLPYWLRHYENIADRIFIWDDQSDDGTHEMLAAHPKVTFLPMEKHGDDDDYWIAHLFPQYEQHSRDCADWVMVADADEFIYHERLRDVLEIEWMKGTQAIWCKGYAMISDHLPTGSGQIYDEIRTGLPDQIENKWTIHSPDINWRFKKGRHGGPKWGGDVICNAYTGIKLLHYRYLGVDYFEAKDRRNAERLEMVINLGYTYDPRKVRRLPSGARGVALDWYAKNKDKAFDVI